MSTRLVDLTQYCEWQSFSVKPRHPIINDAYSREFDIPLTDALKFDQNAASTFAARYKERKQSPPAPKPISSELLESVQVFNEALTAAVPTYGRTVMLDRESVTGYVPMKEQLRRAEKLLDPPFPINCPTCGQFNEWMHEHKCKMTLSRAVAVLNERHSEGGIAWTYTGPNAHRCVKGSDGVSMCSLYLTEFEAIAIAEALLKSSDTAL